MKRLLTDCPRHTFKSLKGIEIKDSELKDNQGRQVVNCNVCGMGNGRGDCTVIKALAKEVCNV